ncbi:hypothetical protein NMG60_11003669 [Bertholletia excelsa]
MEEFPCSAELAVASALVLLSTKPPFLSPPIHSKSAEPKSSFPLCNSKSCSSSVTCDDGSSAEIRTRPLRMVAVVARCHEMKLKVVRKSRSKKHRKKVNSGGKPAAVSWGCTSDTTEASSSLSSSSTTVSSARSGDRRKAAPAARDLKMKPKQPVSSALMRRRAEAIKRLLSNGSASEVRIRQLLGDSPDTSKALRMLLKREEVKRTGAGGRSDPYIYTVMERGLQIGQLKVNIIDSTLFNLI